jgi:hypothetical protein
VVNELTNPTPEMVLDTMKRLDSAFDGSTRQTDPTMPTGTA